MKRGVRDQNPRAIATGLLVATLLLVGCATAPPNPTRDGATLVTDTACFSSPDPTGVVTVALCGATVVHHGVWWLLERRSAPTTPAMVSELRTVDAATFRNPGATDGLDDHCFDGRECSLTT
jgi:hypothetical protein